MTEHFFAPLGMDDSSTFLLEEVDKTLLASPHAPDAAGVTAVTKAQPYHRPSPQPTTSSPMWRTWQSWPSSA